MQDLAAAVTSCIIKQLCCCCFFLPFSRSHLAAAEGCYSVAVWLLEECQAVANPVDRFKRTPLEDAVRGDHGEVVSLLIKHGGQVRSLNRCDRVATLKP